MERENTYILNLKNQLKNISLFKLAIRLNVNIEVIVYILERAGHVLPSNKPNMYLNEKHLNTISIAFSNSVKDLYFKFLKTFKKESQSSRLEKLKFFKQFSNKLEFISEDIDIYPALDNLLIENFFYRLVSTINSTVGGVFSKCYIYFDLKIRIVISFLDFHKKTITIFILYHFYNYTLEEDSERSNYMCFS
ncbi:MAG: hypothetical protein WCK82_11750 [Bacteroidota bacterium]